MLSARTPARSLLDFQRTVAGLLRLELLALFLRGQATGSYALYLAAERG